MQTSQSIEHALANIVGSFYGYEESSVFQMSVMIILM